MKAYDPVLRQLRRRGATLVRTAYGYKGRCPFHEGWEDSLHIGADPEGRVVLMTRCGCRPEDVLRRLGLSPEEIPLSPGRQAERELFNGRDIAEELAVPWSIVVTALQNLRLRGYCFLPGARRWKKCRMYTREHLEAVCRLLADWGKGRRR